MPRREIGSHYKNYDQVSKIKSFTRRAIPKFDFIDRSADFRPILKFTCTNKQCKHQILIICPSCFKGDYLPDHSETTLICKTCNHKQSEVICPECQTPIRAMFLAQQIKKFTVLTEKSDKYQFIVILGISALVALFVYLLIESVYSL